MIFVCVDSIREENLLRAGELPRAFAGLNKDSADAERVQQETRMSHKIHIGIVPVQNLDNQNRDPSDQAYMYCQFVQKFSRFHSNPSLIKIPS